MRLFNPWKGEHYSKGYRGKKILILGESHYAPDKCLRASFTQEIVERLAIQEKYPFYTKVLRLVTGKRDWISPSDKSTFWHSVAFSNFIHAFPDTVARRNRPTEDMWMTGAAAFPQTYSELSPDLLIILGSDLQRNIAKFISADLIDCQRCAVDHPSSFGFKYKDWEQQIESCFTSGSVSTNLGLSVTSPIPENAETAVLESPLMGFTIEIQFKNSLSDSEQQSAKRSFILEVLEPNRLTFFGPGQHLSGLVSGIYPSTASNEHRIKVMDWCGSRNDIEIYTVSELMESPVE